MRATTALLGKDCRQVRWFLIGGLAFFVGFPLLEAFWMYSRAHIFRTYIPEGLVPSLGGVFAIIVAAGLLCGELERKIHTFWRSRPVALWRWLGSKYIVGLVCVLIVTIVPLVMQIVLEKINPTDWENIMPWTLLMFHSYTLVLVYSISFLISCLLRKSTQAAILSLAAALLVYFLPVLVPSLEKVSILNKLEQRTQCKFEIVSGDSELVGPQWMGHIKETWGYYYGAPQRLWARLGGDFVLVLHYFRGYWLFVGSMLGGSLAAGIGAWFVMKHDIRVRMGQKLLVWSFGTVFVLMLCTVAFSLGTNLKCEGRYVIKHKNEWKDVGLTNSCIEGDSGLLFYSRYDRDKKVRFTVSMVKYELTNSGEFEKKKYSLEGLNLSLSYGERIVWSEERPEFVWVLHFDSEMVDNKNKKVSLSLVTLKLDVESGKAVLINEMKLAEHVSEVNERGGYSTPGGRAIVLHKDTIYAHVYGKLKMIDVSEPAEPKVIKTVEKYGTHMSEGGGGGKSWKTIRIIPDERLSEEERIEITVKLRDYPIVVSEGHKMAEVMREFMRVYELKGAGAESASFESDTFRRPTPLERIIGIRPKKALLKDDFLYVLSGQSGFAQGVTVYDISRPGLIKRAGHYAVPDEDFQDMTIREDGMLVVVGNSVHVVKGPKRN
jgi:hypothetical protein